MNARTSILRAVGGLLAVASLTLVFLPQDAAAQVPGDGPAVLFACYVPGSGVVYRVDGPGPDTDLPDDCRTPRHVLFSWSESGPAGSDGADGEDGQDGISCWDTNQNGVADPEEDTNGDGVVDVMDCLGEGTPGEDGEDGLACWDVDGDGVADPEEDVNGDSVHDALDCRGPEGPAGPEGPEGPEGPQGPQGPAGGTACRLPGAPVPVGAPYDAMGGAAAATVRYAPVAAPDLPAAGVATAGGADAFLGQMMLVPYNFAPRGWVDAAGQLLPIASNSALFSLLGTTYGGDGRTTFALPDMRGLEPVCGQRWVIATVGIFPSRN